MGLFYRVDLFDSPTAMPAWSPDGNKVLYTDPFESFDDTHPLYIFEIAGDNRTRVGGGTEATWFDDDTLIVQD